MSNTFQKITDQVLEVTHGVDLPTDKPGKKKTEVVRILFDFEFGVATTNAYTQSSIGGGTVARQVIPFSQFDQEVLRSMRQKLIMEGGKPRALSGQVRAEQAVVAPAAAPAAPKAPSI